MLDSPAPPLKPWFLFAGGFFYFDRDQQLFVYVLLNQYNTKKQFSE